MGVIYWLFVDFTGVCLFLYYVHLIKVLLSIDDYWIVSLGLYCGFAL